MQCQECDIGKNVTQEECSRPSKLPGKDFITVKRLSVLFKNVCSLHFSRPGVPNHGYSFLHCTCVYLLEI